MLGSHLKQSNSFLEVKQQIYKKDKSELQCQTLKSRLSYDMKIKSQGKRLTAAAADGPVVLEWHLTSAEGGKCQVFSVRQRTHCAFR